MENNFFSVGDERGVVGRERKRAGDFPQSVNPMFPSPIREFHKTFTNDTTHNISRLIMQLSET
jgi:hypothetical protein